MKPYPYQKRGVIAIERFGGRALLADEMGLGKTMQALWWLRRNPDALPAVIVCPAGAKWHWEREAATNAGLKTTVLEGRNGTCPTEPVTIVNYDILQHRLKELRGLKPGAVILDECQYAANPKAIRTKAVRSLCRGVPNVLAMSGTPLLNRPIELWPVLNILRPDVFQSRWKYMEKFCDLKRTYWGWDYRGASNLVELNELLTKTCMIRRRKNDVLPELPPKSRHVLTLPLSDPEEYRRADEDFMAWLRERRPDRASSAARAEALVRLGYLKRLAARLKFRYVVGWANDFLRSSGGKLVLFAVHRKAIEALRRRCEADSVVVDGTVTGRKRQDAVDRFQQDPSVRLLIGNIRAAGTAITLTAASTVAFVELDWRPGDHVQAEDREHRLTQTRPVSVYYLVAHGTVEEGLCKLLQKKQEVLSSTLDGEGGGEGLPLFDELLKEMVEGQGV